MCCADNAADLLQHACVVRCFAMEEDSEFVYLALERCKYSLADMLAVTPSLEAMFVDAQGYPTPWCMQVCHCAPACLRFALLCPVRRWPLMHARLPLCTCMLSLCPALLVSALLQSALPELLGMAVVP